MTDRDALCVALAGHLGLALASDDRKMRGVATSLVPRLEMVSTLDLIKAACDALSLPQGEVSGMLRAMWEGARFDPPKGDPLGGLYREGLGG